MFKKLFSYFIMLINIIKGKRICIICEETHPVEKFRPEHIFPESIGGQYTIHSICEDCNSRFNRKIDNPFKNLKKIDLERIRNNQTKGRNVVRRASINLNEQKYLLRMRQDGRFEMYPPYIQNGKKDQKTIVINEKNELEQLLPWAEKDMNVLRLTCAKILFEIATDLIPEYVTDELAKKYSVMLYNGEFDRKLQGELQPSRTIWDRVHSDIGNNFIVAEEEHSALISLFPGVGLIGFVKIYNFTHVVILSRKETYKVNLFIFNNFKRKSLNIYQSDKAPTSNITVRDSLSNTDLEQLASEFRSSTNVQDKDCPLLDRNGKVVFKYAVDLNKSFDYHRNIIGDFKPELKTEHLVKGRLFMKSKKLNRLLPVESVTTDWKMKLIKKK